MVFLALTAVLTVGIWYFSEMLGDGAETAGKKLRLSPAATGSLLLAPASSAPELITVFVALAAGSFSAGLGTVAGSALFNILIIPAAAVLAAGDLKIAKAVVKRDGMAYLVVVVLLITATWFGTSTMTGSVEWHFLPWWTGLIGLVLYAGYVAWVIWAGRKEGRSDKEDASDSWGKVLFKIIFGVVGIGICVHLLVEITLTICRTHGIADAIAGVIVLAPATSIPDTFLSVLAARKGDADGAITNAFGSNIFDILVGLGLPILWVGGVAINWAGNWVLLAFLMASTMISITFLITDWKLSKREAWILISIYLIFFSLAMTGCIPT